MKLKINQWVLGIWIIVAGVFGLFMGTSVLVWVRVLWPLAVLNYVPGLFDLGIGVQMVRSK